MKTASELENIIIIKELKIKEQNLEIERLNNIIASVLEYLDMCETFAMVDKKIILSVSTIRKLLKKEVIKSEVN